MSNNISSDDIKKNDITYKDLSFLLNSTYLRTELKCDYTNIIDQNLGKTYSIPCFAGEIIDDFKINYKNNNEETKNEDYIKKFFKYIEECRLKKIYLNFSEKQTFKIKSINLIDSENDIFIDKSCIEYDFDIYLKEKKEFDDSFYEYIIECMCYELQEIIDFKSIFGGLTTVHEYDGSLKHFIHFCILSKPQRIINSPDNFVYKQFGECYKESFHIRIFLKVTKEVKIFLRQKLMNNKKFAEIFNDKNIINDIDNIFDRAACSNPAMMLGSMKKNGTSPHIFKKMYKMEFRGGMYACRMDDNYKIIEKKESRKKGRTLVEHVKKIPEINMAYDLSLHFENPNGKIKKGYAKVKPEYETDVITYNERRTCEIEDIKIKDIEDKLNELKSYDIDAEYIINILDILSDKRVKDFSEWRKIIYILASKGEDYRYVAIYFSIRSPEQFNNNGLNMINNIFKSYEIKKINENSMDNIDNDFKDLFAQSQLSEKTLFYWASIDNPEKYDRLRITSYHQVILNLLYKTKTTLKDTQIAQIIKVILKDKYITLKATSTKSTDIYSNYIWYKFIDEPKYTGAGAYKWQRMEHNEEIHEYIEKKLTKIIEGIIEIRKNDLNKMKKVDDDETDPETIKDTGKYIERDINILQKTNEECVKSTFITSCVKSCKLKFRLSGINEDNVDKYENYIGVKNGILKLYPNTEFIDSYHKIFITKSTNAFYQTYDSNNIYVKRLEKVFKEIFSNDIETYEYFMMFMASGLDDREKNPQLIFILHGVGSQGKSVLAEFHQEVFGETNNKSCKGYTTKINTEWLCSSRSSSGPDSTAASLDGARSIFVSEIETGAEFNAAKIKELLSERISYNQKYKEQQTTKINANILSTNNADPNMSEVDNGMRRRVNYFRLKNTYYLKGSRDYNPNNPRHKIANKDIMEKWKKQQEYKNAYFSIMLHYYEILRDKYKYNFGDIPQSNIRKETEEYFERQDPISKFIKCRMIYVGKRYPGNGEPVKPIRIKDIFHEYKKWYTSEYGLLTGLNSTHCNNFEKNYKLHNNIKVHKTGGANVTFLEEFVLVTSEENYDDIYSEIFYLDKILKASDNDISKEEKKNILSKQIEISRNKISNIKIEYDNLKSIEETYLMELHEYENKYSSLLADEIDM